MPSKMSIKVFRALTAFLLLAQMNLSVVVAVDCRQETRCRITRAHKMKVADCYRRELMHFPKCLPTDVEVIELTSNRIRKFSRSDLSQFKYLEILYLQDNLIYKMDDDIFQDQQDLTTLDLSLNAITKVPSTIFQMPSLSKLYLGQNMNMNIVDALEAAKPIVSPLEKVDISFTTDEDNIVEFPDFGPLPFLTVLNITGNQYTTMNAKSFMGFCQLQMLINDNVTTGFDVACDCWKINYRLAKMEVKFSPFACTVEKSKCLYTNYTEDEIAVNNQCVKILEQLEKQYRILKISVGVGVAVAILIVSGIVYFFICRRKRAKRPVDKNGPKKPPDNLGLLNNHQKTVPNEYIL